MFDDSAIASRVTLGANKTNYLITFGLTVHISKLINAEVKRCPSAVSIMFDEYVDGVFLMAILLSKVDFQ